MFSFFAFSVFPEKFAFYFGGPRISERPPTLDLSARRQGPSSSVCVVFTENILHRIWQQSFSIDYFVSYKVIRESIQRITAKGYFNSKALQGRAEGWLLAALVHLPVAPQVFFLAPLLVGREDFFSASHAGIKNTLKTTSLIRDTFISWELRSNCSCLV